MRCNIYRGPQMLEMNVFFWTFEKAEKYCKYICPTKYGSGNYYAVIVRK